MISASGAGVAAVEHEFFRTEARQVRFFIESVGILHQFVPTLGRRGVDLDDAGVRGDLDDVDAIVVGRLVSLDEDGEIQFGGGVLDGGDEFEIIFQIALRGHEDSEDAAARFGAEGGADEPGSPLPYRRG